MSSSDNSAKPLAVNFNEERLKAWKDKRAKIAATSRQERERQAEAERTDKLRKQEQDKEARIKEAAEKRAAAEAADKAERLQAARIRLAGRADVDAARKRLQAYRTKAAKQLVLRVAAFIIAPTLAVAAYLIMIATPLFEAQTQFAIRGHVGQGSATASFLAPPAGHRDAAQIRAFILSPQMMISLDLENGFFAHLGSDDVDFLSRLKPVPALQITELDQYKRAVQVQINSQEGILTLSTRGRDPDTAEMFAQTILANVSSHIDTEYRSLAGTTPKLHVISAPIAAEIAAYPRIPAGILLSLFGFSAVFALISIFGATLRRHGHIE